MDNTKGMFGSCGNLIGDGKLNAQDNSLMRLLWPIIFAMFWGATACAQPYPVRPIRLVVPFPPGGVADIAARTVFQKVGEQLGQQVVLDNRGGGNTIIGTDMVAKAPSDGYTLISVPINYAVNPSLYKKLPYDHKDLRAIALYGVSPNFLVINSSIPARSTKELIALAQASPGKLSYATGGVGSAAHLAGELFKLTVHVDMSHVPYKGAGFAITALISGEVSLLIATVSSLLPHIQTGRMRALAIAHDKRSPVLPNVPTLAESGVPNCEISSWHGVMAPAGTPREIILKLNAEIAKTLRLPEVIERFVAIDFEPRPGTPEDFDRFIKSETQKWATVIRTAKLSLNE